MKRAGRRMVAWSLAVLALLVLVAGIVAWIVAVRFAASIDASMADVRSTPAAAATRTVLPPLMAAYLARTGAGGGAAPRSVQITQRGAMRLDPDGAWLDFTADQVFAVAAPSFVWRARFRTFRVVDSVVHGQGRLEARLFGVVPVARASGPTATRAELQRYLAEIVWVPHAIAHNRHITWRQVGDAEVAGVLEHAGQRVELRFFFDEQGDIVRVAGTRDRMVGDTAVATPWVGRFSDFAVVGGVRIPTRGEVEWGLETGAFAYWRGTITGFGME